MARIAGRKPAIRPITAEKANAPPYSHGGMKEIMPSVPWGTNICRKARPFSALLSWYETT